MTQKEKSIGWYVIAFLDLLGQQDKLRQVTALPNIKNQEEVNAFKDKVRELYKPIYSLRKFFATSIEAVSKIDENGLTVSQIEILKQSRSTPISYRYFSDSLIVYVPLRNDIGKFQCRAIYSVLAATAMTLLSCMSMGSAIRGGIDVGLAMDIDEGELYGPALARAHTLESKVAQYPRIVIGEELIRYLREVAGQQASTSEERAHVELAKSSLKLLAVDDDGHTFLDYLGDDIRITLQFGPINNVVQEAYNFIIQEAIMHKEGLNSKLGFRYTLLRNYFESRLPLWGISLQSE